MSKIKVSIQTYNSLDNKNLNSTGISSFQNRNENNKNFTENITLNSDNRTYGTNGVNKAFYRTQIDNMLYSRNRTYGTNGVNRARNQELLLSSFQRTNLKNNNLSIKKDEKNNNKTVNNVSNVSESKVNKINYEDYMKNPDKYKYILNNKIPNYVMDLYNNYKIFSSPKMEQLIKNRKFIYEDKQLKLKKVLDRYYMDITLDEVAYIDSLHNKVYLKCGLIFTIKDNYIESVKNINNNTDYILEYGKTYFNTYIDKKNNIIYKGKNKKLSNINVFDDENISSNQYGGSQMAFSKNAMLLLANPYIINKMREYFPNDSMEDYELYLNKLCNCGCGYTAMINTVFYAYAGKEEQFERDFGFPMYSIRKDGSVDYNYEYLILDYFNYTNANTGYTIQELYGDIKKGSKDGSISGDKKTGKAHGFTKASYAQFKKYMSEKYNIKISLDERYLNSSSNSKYINSKNSFEYSNIISAYNDIKKDNNIVVIGSGSYQLKNMDGTICVQKGGGHCMTITGVTDDGNFIVSSWGKKYIFDIKATQRNGGNIDLHAVNFE